MTNRAGRCSIFRVGEMFTRKIKLFKLLGMITLKDMPDFLRLGGGEDGTLGRLPGLDRETAEKIGTSEEERNEQTCPGRDPEEAL